MIDFCFSNNVSVSSVHESLLRHCDIRYARYLLARGIRSEKILSRVVAFDFSFAFSKSIPHFLS